MQDLTEALDPIPQPPPPRRSGPEFPVVLRGYDREAVDAYVESAGELIADLQATRTPDGAVHQALERVGEEVASILRRAHDTAEEITAKSRREADERLRAARLEAHQITASAREQLRDLDLDTDRIWAERHRIIDDVSELGGELTELANAAKQRLSAGHQGPSQGGHRELSPMDQKLSWGDRELAAEDPELMVDQELSVEDREVSWGERALRGEEPDGLAHVEQEDANANSDAGSDAQTIVMDAPVNDDEDTESGRDTPGGAKAGRDRDEADAVGALPEDNGIDSEGIDSEVVSVRRSSSRRKQPRSAGESSKR